MSGHSKHRCEVEELLAGECRGLSAGRTIAYLLDRGLISYSSSRAYLARQKVEEQMGRGLSKVAAMEIVAEEMGCAYATIRNYLYHEYKN